MADNFIQVFLDRAFEEKEQVLNFIAEQANPLEKDYLVGLLKEREVVGSIFIAEQIILPHLESSRVESSRILFIKLRRELPWDDKGNVKLAVVILLKKQEKQEIKLKISQFTRTLEIGRAHV